MAASFRRYTDLLYRYYNIDIRRVWHGEIGYNIKVKLRTIYIRDRQRLTAARTSRQVILYVAIKTRSPYHGVLSDYSRRV